jgi:hypothetical protein
MNIFGSILFAAAAWSEVQAQPGPGKGGKKGGGPAETMESFVDRVMAFNKAKNGKLTKEELTDTRLHALFDRADANKDGFVTREELQALYERETAAFQKGGFGDKDGFGDKGKGFGDKKGFAKGPPQPGVILSPFLQDVLKLSDAQRQQVADLQKEVDARLEKILNADQRQQLREMRERGPGGFGPPDKKGFGDKKGPPAGDK